jgi:hypothetical protein
VKKRKSSKITPLLPSSGQKLAKQEQQPRRLATLRPSFGNPISISPSCRHHDQSPNMAMTTSVTRSRRAEGIHLPNPKIANAHRLLANAKDHYAPRPKRQLDASDREFDPVVAKKARFTTGIAVEIPARSSYHARFAKETTDADAKPAPRAPKPAIAAPNNPPTSHRAPPAKGPKSAPAARTQHQQQQEQQPTLTKHQEKVANGLKHELDRLQPNAADTKEQGRKLRSQEATRFKSELSAYFPEYDEVIGNDPKETRTSTVSINTFHTTSVWLRTNC